MAKYPKLHTTNKGRELVSMANVQNKAVTYTKAVLGDGSFSGNIDTLTNLVSAKMECLFNNASNIGNGQFQLDFVIDNKKLENGFYAREVGIFAKIDNGEEILFAYTNGGNYVDYIPDKSTPIDAQIIEADINIGDAESVTIVRSDSTYLTFKDLQNHDNNADAHKALMTKHNSDISSHPAITAVLAKILGDTNWQANPADNLKNIKNLLGFGGIVAQRLETNGYVKFANGFTMQWIDGNNTVYYPVAFSRFNIAVSIHKGTNARINSITSYDSDNTKYVPLFNEQSDNRITVIAVGV